MLKANRGNVNWYLIANKVLVTNAITRFGNIETLVIFSNKDRNITHMV